MKLSKTEEAIIYILQNSKPMLKTKLVKTLFLADKEAYSKLQHQITDFEYVNYLYGPYPKNFESILNKLYSQNIIYYYMLTKENGETYYLISYNNDVDYKVQILSDDEQSIIKGIISKYGEKNLDEILSYVYNLPEIKHTQFGDKIFVRGDK